MEAFICFMRSVVKEDRVCEIGSFKQLNSNMNQAWLGWHVGFSPEAAY